MRKTITMISIVVYTHNDEQTIQQCLDSLREQHANGRINVFVFDDNSSDNTATIVLQHFPHFRLIRENRTCGWLGMLRKHLPTIHDNIIAFLGAHCQAHPDWLAILEQDMGQGHQIITGRGYHGEQQLLQRFEAAFIHSDFLSDIPAKVFFLWDDNFAITTELLAELLYKAIPQSDAVLSDGAGAALLSLQLRKMNIPIHYRPQVKINHISHSFAGLIDICYNEIAINAIALKLEDTSLPGARFLWSGPIIAAAFTLNRFLQGIGSLVQARHSLRIRWFEFGIHTFLMAILMPVYYAGLCREMWSRRDQIWSRRKENYRKR